MSSNTLKTLKEYGDRMDGFEKCVEDATASLQRADDAASVEPLNILSDELSSISRQLDEMLSKSVDKLIDELNSGRSKATERRTALKARSKNLRIKIKNTHMLLKKKIERCMKRGHTEAQEKRASILPLSELSNARMYAQIVAEEEAAERGEDATSDSHPLSASGVDAMGAAEWQELLTDTGDVYYYNESTGESSWELPAGVKDVAKSEAIGGTWELVHF
jgi:hypothetical protein